MAPKILLKIGGRAFADRSGFAELASAIRSHPKVPVILVHGGGSEISQALKAAGRETEFVDGMRVTRAEDIKIVEAVLSGSVNHRIADWLTAEGVKCRSVSGKTEQLFLVTPLTRRGRSLGYVGEIQKVDTRCIAAALASGEVPVVSPISADESGQSYNVNADSAAAALAAAAGCSDLVFLTDVPGVLVAGQTRETVTTAQARKLITEKVIVGGMVAKIESALDALSRQVARVHIVNWQGPATYDDIVAQRCRSGSIVTN